MQRQETDEVTFINRFVVHTSDAEFEDVFASSSTFMAAQPGFVGHTLLRETDTAGRYVNIAHWVDEQSFRSAVASPEFGPHRQALRAVATSDPALYQPRLHRGADIRSQEES